MENAGDVRRAVASICDRSFDLISILRTVDLGSNSYIGIKIVVSQQSIFKDWFRSTRSTQNDRNDHRMISGFRWNPRFDSVFIDEISIFQANLDFQFSL